jgi:phosphoserine phosphatase
MGIAQFASGQRISGKGGRLNIFDVDGTILPGTSCERLFVRYLIRHHVLGTGSFFNFCLRGIMLIPKGRYYIIKANKGYLRGHSFDAVSQIGQDFFRDVVVPLISSKALERIKRYHLAGQRVILFSGMPEFLLANFAQHLGVREYYGSIAEVVDGKFTGRTLGPFPLGRGKIEALEMILSGAGFWSSRGFEETSAFSISSHTSPSLTHVPVDWPSITYYGDHWTDRHLLSVVGHPVVINGDIRLLDLAKIKGWPVEDWR